MSGGGWLLAIDFGTTRTAAAVMVPGTDPELVPFETGDERGAATTMPSTVFYDASGEFLAGYAAEDAMMSALDRTERTPKAKLRGGHVVETLGDESVPVMALVEAVLAEAYNAARGHTGGSEPDRVILTCPVAWTPGGPQWRALNAAAHLAGIEVTAIMPEPEAATHHVAVAGAPLGEGEACAVYDLGGGTCDITVMRRSATGLRALATKEDEVGGETFDERLYLEVVALVEGRAPDAARRLREVRDDPLGSRDFEARYCQAYTADRVRRAKERLSSGDACPVFVPPPADLELTLTRRRLEELISGDLERTARLLAACIRDSTVDGGGRGRGLARVYLVGGASQIPAVAALVQAVTGQAPLLSDHPKGAVALGAVRALAEQTAPGSGRRSAPPTDSRSAVATRDRQVHVAEAIDVRRYDDSLLVLHLRDGGPRLSRFVPRERRVVAEVELPEERFDRLTCGAAGIAALGARRLVLLDHALAVRGGRDEPVFARVGATVAWVGYLGEGREERGLLKREARPLRVRTFLLAGPRPGMADDVHVGTITVAPPPRALGGLDQLRPEPPPCTVSDSGGDGVDRLWLMVQRLRRGRLGATSWSQDRLRVEPDGSCTVVEEVTERPWTLAFLRRGDHDIRLAGREPERTVGPLHARFGRAPGTVTVDDRPLRQFVDERVEMALYPGAHDVHLLSRNWGPASEGGSWWELHRCRPEGADRLHRGETPSARWTGEDAGGTWFWEEVWDEEPTARGVYARANGSVQIVALERDARSLPLAVMDGRLYALATPPGEPTALVSYPWHG